MDNNDLEEELESFDENNNLSTSPNNDIDNNERYTAKKRNPEQSQEARNIQNNANNIRNAADVAIASKNPYAMAAGGAVKAADKLTGGKASEKAGQAINTLNKFSPAGKKIQKISNKLSESGASDKIGKIASMKNGTGSVASKAGKTTSGAEKLVNTENKEKSISQNNKQITNNRKETNVSSEEAQENVQTSSSLLSSKVKSKIVLFFIKHPMVLIGIVGIALLLLVLFIIISAFTLGDNEYGDFYGLNGYEYIEPKCKEITVTEGSDAGTYNLEEYIAGVVAAEFGTFVNEKWQEAAKAGAIAARSFVLTHINDNCEIGNSSKLQNFKKATNATFEIAKQTKGLVLSKSGAIVSTQYDAFCTDSPQDDPDNYIVCQQNQKVPRSWADSQKGIASSWKSGTKSGAHGNGMSAWGSAYLAETGYTFEEILSYYYPEFTLASVYPSFNVTNNWTVEIGLQVTSSLQVSIASSPLRSLLSEGQYNEINNLIYSGVTEAGIGTRDAVVLAAVTPIKYLAEVKGVLIPYTLGGGHYMTISRNSDGKNIQKTTTNYYGIDPDWGTPISHTWDGNYYKNFGPDCSSFVPWTFHNAGMNMPVDLAGQFSKYGERESTCSSYIAKPGDLLESSGHITLIVGVDEANSKYYIAHASGGAYGVKISTMSFCAQGYWIVNMDKYYANPSNINQNYEVNYERGVIRY